MTTIAAVATLFVACLAGRLVVLAWLRSEARWRRRRERKETDDVA